MTKTKINEVDPEVIIENEKMVASLLRAANPGYTVRTSRVRFDGTLVSGTIFYLHTIHQEEKKTPPDSMSCFVANLGEKAKISILITKDRQAIFPGDHHTPYRVISVANHRSRKKPLNLKIMSRDKTYPLLSRQKRKANKTAKKKAA